MIPIDAAYEAQHRKNVDKYSKRLTTLYNSYIKDITEYAASKGSNYTPGEPLPSVIQNKLKELSKAMIGDVEGLIVEGVNSSWDEAVEKNNAIATKIYGTSLDKLPKEYREKYLSNNGAARDAFLKRKEDGLGLSDRVWNNSVQLRQELELGLELGLLDGKSAQAMARDLKQYLNDPDKLFRRVRDKFGELRLSKAAAAYHPGQGRYRSSYKNALRLTRNEINFSYEKSQFLKRQQQDFIVGIEIKVSPSHDPSDDKGGISCFGLQGKYPKEFEFTNKWHVNCKCQSFHILKTPDELDEDLGLILDGKQPLKTSANKIDTLPQQYKSYLDSISEKGKDWMGKQRTFSINEKLMKSLEKIAPGVSIEDFEKVISRDSAYRPFRNIGSPTEQTLKAYTEKGFKVNTRLLNNPNEIDLLYRDNLNKALDTLPEFSGVSYRGMYFKDDNEWDEYIKDMEPGGALEFIGFTSSSKDRVQAELFAGGGFYDRVFFTIEGKTGRDLQNISSIREEQEVLFKTNTKFKIISKSIEGRTCNVKLKEI